ncbi:MAG: hypothetical protein A2X52_06705 [Candidatus Rokubacteria bacterium GWC2_70_16]|nr:MAG: hypothetical protein A2X52_06705 [Candidatus Rokubacteria bacterium GWC2_70_16]
MREYHYLVDREGRVFHDGTEIVDPAVLEFFLRAMRRTDDGRYLVLCQGEQNWFAPHDTPFVVQRLGVSGETGRVRGVELRFAGGYREPLAPATLEAEGGHLYCTVRQGAFRARFGRVALQQLAPLLADDGTGPALLLDGRRHPIRGVGRGRPA